MGSRTLGEHLAIDLGAESGRVMIGALDGRRVTLREVHRFANRPVRLPDGLHWNLVGMFQKIVAGLAAAQRGTTVGVDAWGVDYGLLDGDGHLLGVPFHYRDERTAGTMERAFERVPRDELYAVTGIQTIPINTVFQLLAEEGSPALAAAERLLMIPDLVALWLTGRAVGEATAASTTGLLDARTGRWANALIERLGLPSRPFGELVEPGTEIGPVLELHGVGRPLDVLAVAGHDTASAFVAAPARERDVAVLSSGTWSLLGMELDAPVLDERALAFNLTNERGVDGTIRLLSNVMGLWLVQECRRVWKADYAELHRLAAAADPDVPLFDPDDESFLRPGEMPARIAAACERLGQDAPTQPGRVVRAILTSLACKYRLVLERVEAVSGRRAEVVHVIGGGARNALLCRLTADLLGRPVLAGPVEATAMGNVLVQARARGDLGSLADMHEVAAASTHPQAYEPSSERGRSEDTYSRFLELIGLAAPTPART